MLTFLYYWQFIIAVLLIIDDPRLNQLDVGCKCWPRLTMQGWSASCLRSSCRDSLLFVLQ